MPRSVHTVDYRGCVFTLVASEMTEGQWCLSSCYIVGDRPRIFEHRIFVPGLFKSADSALEAGHATAQLWIDHEAPMGTCMRTASLAT